MITILKRLTTTGTEGFLNTPVLIAFSILALYVHAHFVHVVSHPFFYTPYCVVPLLIPGVALSALAFVRISRNRKWKQVGLGGVIALLALPFFFLFLCWVIFAKTPAWTAALLFGEPHSELRQFDIRIQGGRGCDYRAVVVDDLRLFPGRLCVSETFATQYRGQRVQFRLSGERTPLGFRITHFEPVSSDQEQPQ